MIKHLHRRGDSFQYRRAFPADLHRLLSDLTAKGIAFECTEQPQVNTTGPMGKLLLGVLGAVAEFETELRKERQMEGIAKAKARGEYKGRQPLKAEKVEKLKSLVEAGSSISLHHNRPSLHHGIVRVDGGDVLELVAREADA